MSGYIGPVPVPQGIQNKETFTATAGQTTFNTNGYTDGAFISVYLNGVRLINGTDYTATNGSDVVLASAAAASDVVDFESFNSFSLVDQTFDNVTLKNPTHEDTDGGRESAVSFKGEQSGGEISTLAAIQASHDGTSDDQKGDLIFKTNDGSDNNAPTERMRIDSAGATTITVTGNEDTLSLVSTDADASAGPNLNLYRNSASPANNDFLGNIKFVGRNNNSQDVQFAEKEVYITDVTDGAEDGLVNYNVMTNGSNLSYLQLRAETATVVVNEDGSDIDFRVESDANQHMIFTDAEVDRVAIGHSAPVAKLDVMGQGTAATNLSMVIGADEGGTLNPSRTNNTDKACRIGLPHRETSEEYAAIMVCSSTAGANDVSIGGGTGVMNAATQVQIYTAANSTTTTGTTRLKVHSNGNVKIGSNPNTLYSNSPLQVEREESSNDCVIRTRHPSTNSRFHLDFHNSSGTQGNITVNSGSVNFNSTSDYRKKENVNYSWDGTTELKKLKPAKFNFIGNSDTIQGFLAHEVSSVVPVAVMGNKDEVTTKSNVVLDSNSVVVALGISEEEWEAGKQDILYEDGDAIPPEFSVGDVKQGQKYPSDSTWEASKDVPEYQSMDASKLVPLLVKTVQELEARIATLEAE